MDKPILSRGDQIRFLLYENLNSYVAACNYYTAGIIDLNQFENEIKKYNHSLNEITKVYWENYHSNN